MISACFDYNVAATHARTHAPWRVVAFLAESQWVRDIFSGPRVVRADALVLVAFYVDPNLQVTDFGHFVNIAEFSKGQV